MRRTVFKPPKNQSAPLIFIANGSGIAPFIGFLKEREFRKETRHIRRPSEYVNFGEVLLFYGCKSEEEAPYWSFLDSCVQKKIITSFFPCFSRKIPKQYVQDILLKSSDRVLSLLEQNAFILISGDAKWMSKAVAKAWIQMFQMYFKMSEQDATAKLEFLVREKRYLEDVWSD